ncbi:MAG: hypothetical protein EA353_08300 [Puniceicoccaceae bacterium]|nr:MAG: hypothetical protein EA353_08300 [Puniceicoccaceae bacterium]
MDDFESFKAARLKMDPSARKMSDAKWAQAYDAHLRAKDRVGGSQEAGSAGTRKKRRSRGARGGQGSRSGRSHAHSLRQLVREQSAYGDLRLIVDILAWVAIGGVVLSGLVTLFYYTSVPAALIASLNAVVGVIAIVVARLLIQVIIDLPDIALYRAVQSEANASPDSEEADTGGDHEAS